VYELPPGEASPYHWHAGKEEWLVVLAGAHTFLNRSGAEARIATFSMLNRSALPVYPDSGKVAAYRCCFRMADAVDYWDGESAPV
jgi:uncharacterized cupin superfamily protein